jgi:hypothetical protein
LELLLAHHDARGETTWHLLRLNELTREAVSGPSHRVRGSSLSRLQGRGVLGSEFHINEWDERGRRYALHVLDAAKARSLVATRAPAPVGLRSRPSPLAERAGGA